MQQCDISVYNFEFYKAIEHAGEHICKHAMKRCVREEVVDLTDALQVKMLTVNFL